MVSENVTRNQWLFKRPTTRGFFKGQGLNHLVAILYAVTHLVPSLTSKSWIDFRSGKSGAGSFTTSPKSWEELLIAILLVPQEILKNPTQTEN